MTPLTDFGQHFLQRFRANVRPGICLSVPGQVSITKVDHRFVIQPYTIPDFQTAITLTDDLSRLTINPHCIWYCWESFLAYQ